MDYHNAELYHVIRTGFLLDAPSMRLPTEPVPGSMQEFDIEEFELLEDIASWEQWGRSIIAFGKHSGRGVSYNDLAESTDPAFRDYRQWVLSRVNTSSGQCQDLGCFLKIYDLKHECPRRFLGRTWSERMPIELRDRQNGPAVKTFQRRCTPV